MCSISRSRDALALAIANNLVYLLGLHRVTHAFLHIYNLSNTNCHCKDQSPQLHDNYNFSHSMLKTTSTKDLRIMLN